MVELLAPGVYTIETSFRARSIQGVGTSTTAFVGLTRGGPVDGPPRLVTSVREFQRIYGGLADLGVSGRGDGAATNYLGFGVQGYFEEGGSRLYIARVYQAPAAGTGRASAALVGANIADAAHLILSARFPGSAGNGAVAVSEAVSPATDVALDRAPVGTLARSRGAPATPAERSAVRPPAVLTDGMVIRAAIDGNPAADVTITGQPAVATAQQATAATIDIPPGGTLLDITIDGQQTFVQIAAGAGRTREAILDEINGQLLAGAAEVAVDTFSFRSNARGRAIVVRVVAAALLGFTETVTATGSGIRRLDAVTPEDLNALFAVAGPGGADIGLRAGFLPGTRHLHLATVSTGAAASLDLSTTDNAVLTALGFEPVDFAAPIPGTAGVARRVFVRETEAADGWREYTQVGADWTAAAGLASAAVALDDTGHIVTLNLTVTNADGIATSLEGLGFAADHPRYMGRRMQSYDRPEDEPVTDPLILARQGVNPAAVHAAVFAGGARSDSDVLSRTILLVGGSDGAMPPLQSWQDALGRLDLYDDIAIVAAPGSSAYGDLGDAMRRSLIGHAERSRFRIAVLDTAPNQTLANLRTTRGRLDSSYAALYAPWLRVNNPLARRGNEQIPSTVTVPPSGHMAGIYARNDSLRGVHKTPANEVIREAVGFEVEYNQAHQEVLNPIGVNLLRYISGRGYRVYGGRLATSDREIVYVSDRRFLNFVKRSIHVSMQWAVFEPNGPQLWANVREAVASFLYTQWRNRALLGATPEQAFFVRCDRSTITQDDLDNGRLICEVGIAIIKPAEFVVFMIGQKTADSRNA